VKKYIKNV